MDVKQNNKNKKEVNMKYKWKTKVAAPLSFNYENKYPPVIQNINWLKIYWSAVFSENTTQQAIFQKQKSVRQEIILSHHSKQNHVRAVPQKRLTALLVFGETRFGWSSNRNIVPRGAHNSMQNTKLTLKGKTKSKCESVKLT